MKKKITAGFVVQEYEEHQNEHKCTDQYFIASDQVEWEDEEGDGIDAPDHVYQPFSMTISARKYVVKSHSLDLFWNNNEGWTSLASATVFNEEEKDTLSLPINGFWEELPQG
jgi:hypothetical protein